MCSNTMAININMKTWILSINILETTYLTSRIIFILLQVISEKINLKQFYTAHPVKAVYNLVQCSFLLCVWQHPNIIAGLTPMCYVIVTARSLLWTLLTVVATMAVLSAILTPKWLIGPPRHKPSGKAFLLQLTNSIQ